MNEFVLSRSLPLLINTVANQNNFHNFLYLCITFTFTVTVLSPTSVMQKYNSYFYHILTTMYRILGMVVNLKSNAREIGS